MVCNVVNSVVIVFVARDIVYMHNGLRSCSSWLVRLFATVERQ